MECWDAENVYTQTWIPYFLFPKYHFHQCHLVGQVACRVVAGFRAEGPLVLVEECWFLCAPSVSADCLLWDCVMECSHLFDFYKQLPGVFLLLPSPLEVLETQLLASSLLGLQCEVSYLLIVFALLRRAKILLRQCWPYSRQGTWQTILAVPDLLALP